MFERITPWNAPLRPNSQPNLGALLRGAGSKPFIPPPPPPPGRWQRFRKLFTINNVLSPYVLWSFCLAMNLLVVFTAKHVSASTWIFTGFDFGMLFGTFLNRMTGSGDRLKHKLDLLDKDYEIFTKDLDLREYERRYGRL